MTDLTPREIVSELDRFIIGQKDAKRATAVALRNRWRRKQLPDDLREEVYPKNILMIGPTGVGKTEISRRLAKLARAPFIKVEATKFTEVGYVGRDVEQIIRDLVDSAIAQTRDWMREDVKARAHELAEDRVISAIAGEDARDATREMFPITRHKGCAGLPDPLVELLSRALDKDPLRRPQLAGQLASSLGDILCRELGATPPATVQVQRRSGVQSFELVPGRRRVGAGEVCPIQVTGGALLDVHAHLEWSGAPRLAQIRPAAPGASITVDGHAVDTVATLQPGQEVVLGGLSMTLEYPAPAS